MEAVDAFCPRVAGSFPLIPERVVLPVVWRSEVAALVGRGRAVAEIGTTLWSDAITTAMELAEVF